MKRRGTSAPLLFFDLFDPTLSSLLKNLNSIFTVSLLISVISFQSVGSLILHKLWIKLNRHEMKMQILNAVSNDRLTVIAVPLNEDGRSGNSLEFEHDDEFSMNGQMYDIVRSEIRNDSIVYYTIHDVKESSLIQWLKSEVSQRTQKDPASQNRAQLFLSIVQLQYLHGQMVQMFLNYTHQPYPKPVLCSSVDFPRSVEAPPPKLPPFT